ncbi:MAG TPA: hypothetical protein VF885_25865 [Arthrobacter sp.]
MAEHAATPSTQTRHPWRATVRSIFAFLIGLAAAWGLIIEAAGVDPGVGWAATSLGIAAAVTRIMALPAVDYLLRSTPLLAWLAPDKRTE